MQSVPALKQGSMLSPKMLSALPQKNCRMQAGAGAQGSACQC